MGIGVSLFLIAVGAILRFAVNTTVQGIEIQTVGLILMIMGIVGLVLTFLFLMMWRDRTAAPPVERVVEPPPERVIRRDRDIL